MTIKHLVISGGGPVFFKSVGAVQTLEKEGLWNIHNIETIYGTSAGGVLAVILCLKFDDWDIVNDYVIKRPWHEAIKLDVQTIFDSYTKRGLFDGKIMEIIFKPLLAARDISLNVTLKEFYDFTKIELHLFAFDINNFREEDISYITHPNLRLLTAIQMTSALPIIISPVCVDDKCYIDGGIVSNYPLNHCINKCKDVSEILSFKNNYLNSDQYKINNSSTLLDYMVSFIYKMITHLSTEEKQQRVPNEVTYDTNMMNIEHFQSVLIDTELRKKFVNDGSEAAKKFLLSRENNTSDNKL